jgi:hypothetical protein
LRDARLPVVLAAFLACAIALPALAAPEGQVSASLARAQRFAGPLTALLQESQPVGPLAAPDFELSAAALRVETFWSDPTLHVAGNTLAREQHMQNETYRQAFVQGTQAWDHYRLDVFPVRPGAATAEGEAPCSTFEPPVAAQVTRASYVPYAPARDNVLSASLDGSLAWKDCSGGSAVVVRGDFVVTLWQWDAVVHAGGQDIPLPSGQGRSDADPVGRPETQATLSHDRQRYLYVEDGLLRLPRLGDARPLAQLYLGPGAQASSAAGAVLHDARGRLPDGTAVDAAVLELAGGIDLRMAGTGAGRPLAVAFTGSLVGANADGRPLAATTLPAVPAVAPWAVAVAALAALGGAAVWAAVRARPRPGQGSTQEAWERHEQALVLHAGRRNRRAVRLLGHAIRLDPDNPEHYALRAACYANLGILGRRSAVRDRLEAHQLRLSDREGARNAYEASRLLALLGRGSEAAHWLGIALRLDPSYREKAALEPDFAAVAWQAGLRALLAPDAVRPSA